MGTANAVQTDHSSKELRRLPGRVKNAGQARRLLAIASELRLNRDPLGRDDVDRMKRLMPVFDVKTDSVHHSISISKRVGS